MKNTISVKYVDSYIRENYGEPRHDVVAMTKAVRYVGNAFGLNKVAVFHLIIENEPMQGTHSYGFHTAYGRELINKFENKYYEIINS